MSEELKPCPFCGGNELRVEDLTSHVYGFDGYSIICKCGCRVQSESPREQYFKDGKYCTPMTTRSKNKALKGLYDRWNGRAT